MKKIFYWSNDIKENSGEGILARNFLKMFSSYFSNFTDELILMIKTLQIINI